MSEDALNGKGPMCHLELLQCKLDNLNIKEKLIIFGLLTKLSMVADKIHGITKRGLRHDN